MVKVTVLYGHPKSPEDFEQYYEHTHFPIAEKMKGVARFETTKFTTAPDGTRPAYYRMAEIYFANEAQLKATMESPGGRAATADLPKFATGGVTLLIGIVEE